MCRTLRQLIIVSLKHVPKTIFRKHSLSVKTKSRYSFELSPHGSSSSTCSDCDTTIDTPLRPFVRYRSNLNNHDKTTFETLNDAVTVIATVVIATSWITIFTLFLHKL